METSGSPGAGDAQAGSGTPPPVPPPTTTPTGPAVTGPLPYTPPPTGGTSPPGARPESGGLGLSGGDWPTQATNAVVDLVGTVRDRTVGPVTTVARGIVFGLFTAVVALMVAVLLIIAAVRLLDVILPSGVWLPYLVLGVLFVVAGTLVFRKRKVPTP